MRCLELDCIWLLWSNTLANSLNVSPLSRVPLKYRSTCLTTVQCSGPYDVRQETGLDLELFVDADYANRANALSIGGYVAILGSGSITWSSKKQKMVALSMMEVEYIALTEGTKQLVWLRRFLTDLGFNQSQPTSIHSDNLGAITLSHDVSYHARTRHINVTYHFICKRVASNEVVLTYVQSKENPANLMTKALDLSQHQYLRNKLGFSEMLQIEGSVDLYLDLGGSETLVLVIRHGR